MKKNDGKSVAVIGAGIGGMTTALLLSEHGYRVQIFERMPAAGGKMRRFSFADCTFDAGPSLITMPFILQNLFTSLNRSLEDYIELLPIEPLCRYYWSDGSELDAYSQSNKRIQSFRNFSDKADIHVEQYLRHAGEVYNATKDIFLFNPFEGVKEFFKTKNLPFLPKFPKLKTLTSLHTFNKTHLGDKKLVQLFDRFATYNGSDPYKAPATLMVIPYIEFHYGGWYPHGGMYSIAHSLANLCHEKNVEIHYNSTVSNLYKHNNSIKALELENGDIIEADIIVSNADAYWTHKHLLKENISIPELSSSGFVIMAAVRKHTHSLSHHNILFSDNYKQEFDDIFEKKIVAKDMTIYISISSLTDRSQSAADRENWFILVNTPSTGGNNTWQGKSDTYWQMIRKRMAEFNVLLNDEDIIETKFINPDDFSADLLASGGSLYGGSSNSPFSAFLRPKNTSKKYKNLFFAGGTVHPGGGIPLVILSGTITAQEIIKRLPFHKH